MFKKALAALALIAASCCAWAESTVQFCESFNEKFEPIGVGTEFSGLQVSAFTLFGKPIGKNTVVVSLYQDTDVSQTMINRVVNDVNPRWDSFGLRYIQLPQYGKYTITFELDDGTPLATGSFTLVEPTPEAPAPEVKETESYGNTLEALFNKYAPKAN